MANPIFHYTPPSNNPPLSWNPPPPVTYNPPVNFQAYINSSCEPSVTISKQTENTTVWAAASKSEVQAGGEYRFDPPHHHHHGGCVIL